MKDKSKNRNSPESIKKKIKRIKKILFWLTLISLFLSGVSATRDLGLDIISFFVILGYILSTVMLAIPYMYLSMYSALFASSLLAIFVSPMVIYDVVLLIRIFGTENLSIVADSKTWIGFAGSIIGGCITMLALLFTLKHGEKARADDKALAIMPILVFKPAIIENKYLDYNDLKIENISDNIATNIEIIRMISSFVEFNTDHPELHSPAEEIYTFDEREYLIPSPLQSKSDHRLDFKFPLDDSAKYPRGLSFEFVIKYKDILSLRTYYTKFYILYTLVKGTKSFYDVKSYQNLTCEEYSADYYYNIYNSSMDPDEVEL